MLFTFALGTAAGDLVSERMDLGYWLSAVLFGLAIAAVALAHLKLGLDAVWSFWIAYILTRPLGASIGDHLSQPTGDGGLGLGTVITSALFLTVILALVVYLSVTRRDVTEPQRGTRPEQARGRRSGCVQVYAAKVGCGDHSSRSPHGTGRSSPSRGGRPAVTTA
ncbi:hypothetical protein [Streptomyces sp. DSM 15324]|uniref:hypothetical protein n=1 Tax=Streptomyces sp. DSM 15324 TaxID=1739111 RepID=UPI000834B877